MEQDEPEIDHDIFRKKFVSRPRELYNLSKTADSNTSDALLANEIQTVYDSKKTLAETAATPNQLLSNQSSNSKILLQGNNQRFLNKLESSNLISPLPSMQG